MRRFRLCGFVFLGAGPLRYIVGGRGGQGVAVRHRSVRLPYNRVSWVFHVSPLELQIVELIRTVIGCTISVLGSCWTLLLRCVAPKRTSVDLATRVSLL